MSEISGFEVLVLAKEIGRSLRGAYVNNIYTMGSSQLLRFRRPEGEDSWLVLSPKKGVWISARASEREETGPFTSKLRGELERGRLTGSTQGGLDRVYMLEFEGREKVTLVVELMPPGNIVVLGGDGRVRLALNEVRSGSRRVVKGEPYSLPSQSRLSPEEVGTEDVDRMLAAEKTLGKALGRHVAIPRKYVADALGRLGATDDTPAASFAARSGEVAAVLRGMVEKARDAPTPCICETPKGDEVFAYRPEGLKVKAESAAMSDLCDVLFLDEALTPAPVDDPGEAKRKELEATAAKLRDEAASLLVRAKEARESAKAARGAPLAEALGLLKVAGVSLQREPSSPAGASSALYDHAKALEEKSSQSIESAERLAKRASKVRPEVRPRTRQVSRRRGEWFEKFRWFITTGGKLAIGGRDAQTNSVILSRHLDANDTVYHADLFGSPFFVLKGGAAQSEEEVREVAQATVAFSSAWKTGLGSADAYWVAPDQVSSAAPSGEYLARGSYAIRGKKNFVQKMMVELAVGVDGEGRLTAGPEAAVRKSCQRFVILRPHNEKGSETAKRVLKDLSSEDATPATLEEVQRALPAGGGKVVRRS